MTSLTPGFSRSTVVRQAFAGFSLLPAMLPSDQLPLGELGEQPQPNEGQVSFCSKLSWTAILQQSSLQIWKLSPEGKLLPHGQPVLVTFLLCDKTR